MSVSKEVAPKDESAREIENLRAAAERMLEPRYTYHPELDERHVKINGAD